MLIKPECPCGIYREVCDYHKDPVQAVAKPEEFWSHVGFQARQTVKAEPKTTPIDLGYRLSALVDAMQPELEAVGRAQAPVASIVQLAETDAGFSKNVAFDLDPQPAIAPWVTYRSSFAVDASTLESLFAATGIDEVREAVGRSVLCCHATIMRQLEEDLLTGTGKDANGNPTLIGLFGGAISATPATYLGISPLRNPSWYSNVLSNGGLPRQLNPELVCLAERMIYEQTRQTFTNAVVNHDIPRKYGFAMNRGLFMENGQFSGYVGKGPIQSHLAPSGSLCLLTRSGIRSLQLKRTISPQEAVWRKERGIPEPKAISCLADVKPRITAVWPDGERGRITLKVTIAAAVTQRNAQALITDVDIS